MYKGNRQLRIVDFLLPYGKLDAENGLVALVPWDVAEERYVAQFVNNGHPAHPARMALGALLIQRRLKCSDQWLVKHIGENPYLQYFIGMKEYGLCPFGASTLFAFRKRFSEKDLVAILEASVPKAEAEGDSDDGSDPPNSEKAEKTVDEEYTASASGRTTFVCPKASNTVRKVIRLAVRKQLQKDAKLPSKQAEGMV